MIDVMYLFLIIAIGYLIGRIRVKGISLGMSAILLVALIFGQFGFSLPSLIKNLGLACFATAVGFITGPVFLKNLKDRALYFLFLGTLVTLLSGTLCIIFVKLFDLPVSLGLGLFSGAITSTPGLAMALELINDPLVSVGYGIAYPFGVIGLVLLVQILSKYAYVTGNNDSKKLDETDDLASDKLFFVDKNGMFAFSMAMVFGIFVGRLSFRLSDASALSLGISGGTLLSGLLFGSFKKIGTISLYVKKSLLDAMRELGLALFLTAAGLEAGSGFIMTVSEYGVILFLFGILMTLVPSVIVFFVSVKIFKIDVPSSLGAICGGMTSTPALGALSELEDYDKVAAGYAATYAAALLNIIFMIQLINLILN